MPDRSTFYGHGMEDPEVDDLRKVQQIWLGLWGRSARSIV
jgi:hypothetical protein